MERTGALLSSKVPSERLGVLQSQEVFQLCFLDAQLPLSVLSGHTRAAGFFFVTSWVADLGPQHTQLCPGGGAHW